MPRLPAPAGERWRLAGLRERARQIGAVAHEQRETHAYLEALFRDAPVGIAFIDTDLRFVMINETLAVVNGIPAEEHVGRYVLEVLPDIEPSAIEALRHVLTSGEPLREVEVTGRTPASPEHKTWLEDFFQIRAADGEVLGVGVVLADVAARRHSERRVSQLIDSLTSFVGLCLPDGTLLEANRSALDAGGLRPADVIGRKLWDTPWFAWNPEASARLRRAVDRARSGEASRYDVDLMMADGPMTIDFRLVPVIEHGDVVALIPSATDVTARRRSVEQAAGLAALARRLNAAATVDEVAESIRAHTADATGGRHATLALLDDASPGTIRLLQSPGPPERLAQEYRSLPLDSPNHIARAIRTRRTIVALDSLSPEEVGGSQEELGRLRASREAAGVTVTAAVPLIGSEGMPIGALASGWRHAEDVDEELLARMRTVAELCSQAIERARLTDAHMLAAKRSRALSSLAQELATAVTVDEVWRAVERGVPSVVGAQAASLGLIDADAAALVVRYPAQLPAGLASDPVPRPLSVPQPLWVRGPQTDAVRTGQAIFIPSAGDLERRYPGLLESLGLRAPVCIAVLPLRDSADRIIGTLGFSWKTETRFDPLLCSTLDTVSELCGQTLERARLHAAEHELVGGLQRRLLRAMPTVPGLTAHAIYRAAQTAVGIGGDFHDGIVLPDGRLAVVLGDVAGHGMEAAADMAQLRTLLSSLLASGTPLAELFPRADAALGQITAVALATAVAAVVDPAAGTLSYVHAGHPPLILRTPDGATAPLPGARGGLLGLGIAEATPATVPFPPGSVLTGYTDGLIEVREAGLDERIDVLVAAVAGAADDAGPALDAAAIAAAVLGRCVGERPRTDDVALLVVTYPLSPTPVIKEALHPRAGVAPGLCANLP